MTPRGYNTLRSELTKLKALRPALALAIQTAKAHGDLSENADYDAAKNKQGLTEAKIRDIETKLSNAEIIDPKKLGEVDRVVFGVSVKIEDVDSGESKTISLFGADESNVEIGWISIESPMGKALIGKSVGDVAKLDLPGGTKEYEVSEIFVSYEYIEESQ
jgi:transcription elongation factor GreA